MKTALTICLLIAALTGFTQKKQNVYFFRDSYHVASIDSADFIRIISEPDSGSKLYNVTDYYKNGKRKLIGKSSTIDPQKFQGQVATFHENGKRESVAEYEDNVLIGDEYDYFFNARLFMVKTHHKEKQKDGHFDYSFVVTAAYDSLGNQQVTDGAGYFKGNNFNNSIQSKGDSIIEEGNLKNGKREGDWKGKTDRGTFVETYNNNVLVSGIFIDKNGIVTKYSERMTQPTFTGGLIEFNRFLAHNIHYPSYERDRNIMGKVYIGFVVERDGSLSNFKVAIPVSPGLDDAALKGVMASPPWLPGKAFGKLERMSFVVPVSFTITDAK